MATHSSILAWSIPWTEEPRRLQSTGLHSRTRLSKDTHPETVETETARNQHSGQALGLQWVRTSRHRGLDTPPRLDTERRPMSSSRHRLPRGSPQIPAGSQKGKEALHSNTRPEHRRQPRYRPGVAGGHRRAPEGGRSALPGCGQERRPQGPATSGRQRRKREREEG